MAKIELKVELMLDILKKLGSVVGKNDQNLNDDCILIRLKDKDTVQFCATNSVDYLILESTEPTQSNLGNKPKFPIEFPLINFKRLQGIIKAYSNHTGSNIGLAVDPQCNIIISTSFANDIRLNANYNPFLPVPQFTEPDSDHIASLINTELSRIVKGAATIVKDEGAVVSSCVYITTDKSNLNALAFDNSVGGRVFNFDKTLANDNYSNDKTEFTIEVKRLKNAVSNIFNDFSYTLTIRHSNGSSNFVKITPDTVGKFSTHYSNIGYSNIILYIRDVGVKYPHTLSNLFNNFTNLESSQVIRDDFISILTKAIAIEDSQVDNECIELNVDEDKVIIRKSSQYGEFTEEMQSPLSITSPISDSFKPKPILDILEFYKKEYDYWGQKINICRGLSSMSSANHYILSMDNDKSVRYAILGCSTTGSTP